MFITSVPPGQEQLRRAGRAPVVRTPQVSIGLPVYNGENYLAEALDACLAQTFTDFELIISDNASTDGTAAIISAYAARDARIRAFRQPKNIGGGPNQNFVLAQARGEYYKLVAHDDLYAPTLLEQCVAVLDVRPEVVLCHGDMAFIDPEGKELCRYVYEMCTDSPSAPSRFKSLLYTPGGDDEYGVVRTAVARQVLPCGSYHNPGRPMVGEIALHGPFHQVPELLYYRRDHPDRGDRTRAIAARSARMDPRRAGQSATRLVLEYLATYFRVINRAPIAAADRRRCYWHVVVWLLTGAGRSSGVDPLAATQPVRRDRRGGLPRR